MRRAAVLALAITALSVLAPVRAGFNWGAGCDGGSGSFDLDLPNAGDLVNVGAIPSGKWNLSESTQSSSLDPT